MDPVPMEYVCCDLCGSLEQRVVFRKRSCFRSLQFSICRCERCGHTFVNPRIPESLADEVYSKSYYDGAGVDPRFHGETPEKKADARMLVQVIESLRGQGQRILDVGGGSGLLSLAARDQGHSVLFNDISDAAVATARSKQLTAHQGNPEKLLPEHAAAFDVVVALEVVEHVYSPVRFLQTIRQLLKPGGIFIFTTGNVNETIWWGSRWGYLSIPEAHLHYFSPRTMDAALTKAGFSRRINCYPYLFKRWWGVRVLERLGLIDHRRDAQVTGWAGKKVMALCEGAEWLAGRHRFSWAVR